MRRPPAFDGATCVFEYRFPLEALVRRFKYAGDLACGRWLARSLAERVTRERAPELIVVPPLHAARLRERGFNQAVEIAKVVAPACGARLERGLVERVRRDAPQAGLSRRERLGNLRGAFACRRNLHGADVVVVDDVLTTGATGEAMARTLKEAGAARVRLWAVARTPAPGS